MNDFNKITKIAGTQDALDVLSTLRTTYSNMKKLQGLVDRYVRGLEPEFTASVDYLFTVDEVGELGVILGKIGALATDLETNHSNAIGL